MKQKILKSIVIAAGIAGSSMTVQAQDKLEISVDGLVGVLSDYRENGISLTDNDPAFIGNLRFGFGENLYTDFFIANMDSDIGDDVIIDSTVGYNWDGDAYSYGLSASVKSYHGSANDSRFFPEVKASISRDFGIIYIKGGIEYAFDGRWFADSGQAVYTSVDVEIPIPKMSEFTLITHLGYDSIDGVKNPWDWQIGLSAFYKDVELTLSYDDSSMKIDDARGKVSFGLKWYF